MSNLSNSDRFFSNLVLKNGVVDESQVRECLQLKQEYPEKKPDKPSLREIMLDLGYVSSDMVRTAESLYRKKQTDRNDSPSPSFPTIPGYEIKSKIGNGSMSRVYLARQISMNRPVAIKVLSEEAKRDQTYLKRFKREARCTAKFDHINIVNGIDAGVHDGIPYFVMEYVEGSALDEVINEEGPLPIQDCVDITRQIARALNHAHEHGIIHRDVKPDNILLARNGNVKLCDLGLVKQLTSDASLTMAGITVGTPYYMSPEQVCGEDEIDIRTDIYSLGVTTYHTLTGDVPFDGSSPASIMASHVEDSPVPPRRIRVDVGKRLNEIILSMMEKDPDDRYATPKHLLEALDQVETRNRANPKRRTSQMFKRVNGQDYFTSSPVTMSSSAESSNLLAILGIIVVVLAGVALVMM